MAKANVIAEPGKQEIRITRTFDAPRELVFKAMTDPNLVARWWGLKSSQTVVDHLDARPGGSWRFIEKNPTGQDDTFRGVFHAVVAPELIIQTFEYEPLPGNHVLMETLRFEEQDGKTTIHVTSVFQSVEDRDGMVQAGMETGMNESYESLDELLKELQAVAL